MSEEDDFEKFVNETVSHHQESEAALWLMQHLHRSSKLIFINDKTHGVVACNGSPSDVVELEGCVKAVLQKPTLSELAKLVKKEVGE